MSIENDLSPDTFRSVVAHFDLLREVTIAGSIGADNYLLIQQQDAIQHKVILGMSDVEFAAYIVESGDESKKISPDSQLRIDWHKAEHIFVSRSAKLFGAIGGYTLRSCGVVDGVSFIDLTDDTDKNDKLVLIAESETSTTNLSFRKTRDLSVPRRDRSPLDFIGASISMPLPVVPDDIKTIKEAVDRIQTINWQQL